MNSSNLVRNIDPFTSHEAAGIVDPQLGHIQRIVFDFIAKKGTVIDSDLVIWGATMGYAESTLRKRRSELSQMGVLEMVGSRTNARGRKELVWQVSPRYL